MRSLRLAVATTAVAAATFAAAPAARAGGKVKAQFLCGTFVDGQVTDVVPSPKKPKLDVPVGCALKIDANPGGVAAQFAFSTQRYAVDPATGKKTKVDGVSTSDGLGGQSELDQIFQPNQGLDTDPSAIAFKPCEDFDIEADLFDQDGAKVFSKVLHVVQKCPKPRPVKATAECFIVDKDGNFKKLNEASFGDAAGVTCRVTSKDDRVPHADQVTVSGVSHFVVSHDDGTTTPGTSPRRTVDTSCFPTDAGDAFVCDVKFEPGDWSVCTLNTFELQAVDPAGAVLYAKSIKYEEVCGE